jgi:hypothetical protein
VTQTGLRDTLGTGLVLLTISFLLVFVAFMQLVIYFGSPKVDMKTTVSA